MPKGDDNVTCTHNTEHRKYVHRTYSHPFIPQTPIKLHGHQLTHWTELVNCNEPLLTRITSWKRDDILSNGRRSHYSILTISFWQSEIITFQIAIMCSQFEIEKGKSTQQVVLWVITWRRNRSLVSWVGTHTKMFISKQEVSLHRQWSPLINPKEQSNPGSIPGPREEESSLGFPTSSEAALLTNWVLGLGRLQLTLALPFSLSPNIQW